MGLMSVLYDLLYMRSCRAYARHFVRDKPADSILRLLCSVQFLKVHNFWPNFVHPSRFSEKVWSRMLHNRDTQLTLLNDKLLVRDYVAAKVGKDYLIPLLWTGANVEYIPFEELPSKFVIKATHGCAYNILVHDKREIKPQNIRLQLTKWLNENYCQDFCLGIEWGYKNIKPLIIIEDFIGENDQAPVDYKFYCFSGHVEFVTLHFDRFIEHKTRTFDRNFNPHEFSYHFGQWNGECQKPTHFDEMLYLAESLSEGFDFMRVDLYSVKEKIYFSELTPYPGGVSTKFLPVRQDYFLGEKWQHK
ncbi:MAG: hypothetical protein A2W05_00365 [Candidatus Schekmanbacteria bacterium RBG_16_38_10]|uniref:Glycosyl transferase n=1 Tax=Candidatus Schekmanbacteria bacterium RBG_16_38_10 TaxID=1817879 RepID=A0A1F7RPP4_9BACT|nr:MAG: hypothetical protein A2W05_00365 [Candidatus Schekmanbacteria bacterium RBG_16_38_10]